MGRGGSEEGPPSAGAGGRVGIVRCRFCLDPCTGLTSFGTCTRCGVAVYCSRTCQAHDWPRHRPECVPNASSPRVVSQGVGSAAHGGVAHEHSSIMSLPAPEFMARLDPTLYPGYLNPYVPPPMPVPTSNTVRQRASAGGAGGVQGEHLAAISNRTYTVFEDGDLDELLRLDMFGFVGAWAEDWLADIAAMPGYALGLLGSVVGRLPVHSDLLYASVGTLQFEAVAMAALWLGLLLAGLMASATPAHAQACLPVWLVLMISTTAAFLQFPLHAVGFLVVEAFYLWAALTGSTMGNSTVFALGFWLQALLLANLAVHLAHAWLLYARALGPARAQQYARRPTLSLCPARNTASQLRHGCYGVHSMCPYCGEATPVRTSPGRLPVQDSNGNGGQRAANGTGKQAQAQAEAGDEVGVATGACGVCGVNVRMQEATIMDDGGEGAGWVPVYTVEGDRDILHEQLVLCCGPQCMARLNADYRGPPLRPVRSSGRYGDHGCKEVVGVEPCCLASLLPSF